jgi:hypothetical protein
LPIIHAVSSWYHQSVCWLFPAPLIVLWQAHWDCSMNDFGHYSVRKKFSVLLLTGFVKPGQKLSVSNCHKTQLLVYSFVFWLPFAFWRHS